MALMKTRHFAKLFTYLVSTPIYTIAAAICVVDLAP